MRRALVLVLVGVLCLGACGNDEEEAADTSAASTGQPRGEPIVIRSKLAVAASAGAETIATGEVLEGSTLGGSAFCVGGTILDTHPSSDSAAEPHGLVDRTITCQDGTVRVGLTPEVGSTQEAPQGRTQTGTWTIAGGTGEFEGLRGSGKMEIVYGPDDDSPVRETLTGTATRQRRR